MSLSPLWLNLWITCLVICPSLFATVNSQPLETVAHNCARYTFHLQRILIGHDIKVYDFDCRQACAVQFTELEAHLKIYPVVEGPPYYLTLPGWINEDAFLDFCQATSNFCIEKRRSFDLWSQRSDICLGEDSTPALCNPSYLMMQSCACQVLLVLSRVHTVVQPHMPVNSRDPAVQSHFCSTPAIAWRMTATGEFPRKWAAVSYEHPDIEMTGLWCDTRDAEDDATATCFCNAGQDDCLKTDHLRAQAHAHLPPWPWEMS